MKLKIKVWFGFFLFTTVASISLASAATPPIDPTSIFSEEEQGTFFGEWANYNDMRLFTLSDGTKVSYPLRVPSASFVQILGWADLRKLNEYLYCHKVQAVSVLGKALVSLTAIDNIVTGIGRYQELMVGVLAKDANPAVKAREGFFIIQQYVTSKAALSYGVEFWGMPKELAKITVKTGPEGRRSFTVSDNDGYYIVGAVWEDNRSLSPSYQPKTGTFITPKPNQNFVSFVSQYKNIKGNFFNPEPFGESDRVMFNPYSLSKIPTPWVDLLFESNTTPFSPYYWQRGDLMSVIGSVDDVFPLDF